MEKRMRLVQLVVVLGVFILPAYAATFDSNDLYISSNVAKLIERFHWDGYIEVYVEETIPPNVVSPTGFAFAPDGKLWVAVPASNTIRRYDESGLVDSHSGASSPQTIAFGPDRTAYVVEGYAGTSYQNKIKKFNGDTGAYIGTFADVNAVVPALHTIYDIAVGPDGNVYVTADANGVGTVQRFNSATGAYMGQFAVVPGETTAAPEGIAFGRGNKMFVSSYYDGAVYRFDSSTGAYDNFKYGGISRPMGVAVGSNGWLFVASAYTTDGTFIIARFDEADNRDNECLVLDGIEPTYLKFIPTYAPYCGDKHHLYPAGDINADCRVNLLDISSVARHWLECTRPGGCN